jgi:hypothetical protein
VRLVLSTVCLPLLLLVSLSSISSAAPINESINLSGILFPCMNCELRPDGMYRLTLKQEEFLLRPFEARRKLFESTTPERLSHLNKPGEILRFLLSQDVRSEEIQRCLEGFLATDGGRSTLILSFESIYRSHPKEVLELIVSKKLSGEVLEGFKNSSISQSDNGLRLTLLSLNSKEEVSTGLYKIAEESLDQDIDVTLEKLDFLIKILAIPELKSVSAKLTPDLTLIRQTLSKTSELMSSSYSEAGLKPELRRLMRKQRLLSLTGKILQANESDNKEELLKELNAAYDPSLDTPLIHEAFRYLIAAVPNAVEILGHNKDELSARDSTIQMMLNPPPSLESSYIVIALVILAFFGIGAFCLFYWRKVDRLEQRLVLAEGLSFEERRELQKILQKFGLGSNVSLSELQSAFRRQAKKIHPDAQSGPNADESFIKLQQDYNRAKELISAFRR